MRVLLGGAHRARQDARFHRGADFGDSPWPPSFDSKLDGLARFVREVAEKRGHVPAAATDAFLAAGWSQANLVDAIMVVGDKSISNYLHGITKIPVDFPSVEKLAA